MNRFTSNQITRNNHYVPIWYQRGFLGTGQSQLCCLDLSPEEKICYDGRIVRMNGVKRRGLKSCFCEYDLYTTHFGTVVNDEIEKYLFGTIDQKGVKAVRDLIGGNPSEMHNSFQDFFEYLDAQKLRTPKGLDWIKLHYPALSQTQLMVEMQGLRSMHCTMWTEGVREIVSAEESDVKFIVTDHPVTVYNAALPPTSPECSYPGDPLIELVGSQTVFALDANRCLILTHLEYTNNPGASNLTAPRTNARYCGQSIVRTDAFIRKRKISRDEVIAINYLLKSRARKYLAAAESTWLYPELFAGKWQDIAKVLLPRDDLWQFGGELYVGFEDGSTHYQDPFGRTSHAHKYLHRKTSQSNLSPNNDCGCGSGRKFKHCCKNLPKADRPSWDICSIRERNLMLCRAIQDILGLTTGKTWDDVRRDLSDEHVKRIYEVFGILWPKDTNILELLPRETRSAFRCVYLGIADPRTVVEAVIGWLPYFDEVILAHPFINPLHIRPEFSPTESPSQHKEQTLKNVLLLLFLEPYIWSGYVHLIPDPGDFNPMFRTLAHQMAKVRTAGWKMDRESTGSFHALFKDDFHRSRRQLPEDSLKQDFRKYCPKASDTDIESAIAYGKTELAADPYSLLQPAEMGGPWTLLLYKGYSLESAMYLAALTGSAIYTDAAVYWQQLNMHAVQTDRPVADFWIPVVESLQAIDFPIDLNLRTLYEVRQDGLFGGMRSVMRRFAETAWQSNDQLRPDQIALQFTCAAKAMKRQWTSVPTNTLRQTGNIEISVPAGGFMRNDVRRLLLTFGRAKATQSIPFAMLVKLT